MELTNRGIFVLKENWQEYCMHGQIAYAKPIPNDPFTLFPSDAEFFVGVSFEGIVTGPFRQTGPLVEYNDGQLFWKDLDHIRRNQRDYLKPWRLDFEVVIPGVELYSGLRWRAAARILGVDVCKWHDFRRLQVTEQQWAKLREALVAINTTLDHGYDDVVLLDSIPPVTPEDAGDESYWCSEEFLDDICGGPGMAEIQLPDD